MSSTRTISYLIEIEPIRLLSLTLVGLNLISSTSKVTDPDLLAILEAVNDYWKDAFHIVYRRGSL